MKVEQTQSHFKAGGSSGYNGLCRNYYCRFNMSQGFKTTLTIQYSLAIGIC